MHTGKCEHYLCAWVTDDNSNVNDGYHDDDVSVTQTCAGELTTAKL